VKKPVNILYGVDDTPPLSVSVLNGLQQVALISINLIYPVLVLKAVDAPVHVVTGFLAVGMMVLGMGAMLQASRVGPVGSGFLCPSTFTAGYLAPSLLAAKLGGLPLVFGMTIFAGMVEAALAPLLNRLRPIFPPEIAGLVVLMVGWSAANAGLRLLLGAEAPPVSGAEWAVAGICFTVTVALNVWGAGMARMLCAILGLAAGYAAAWVSGLFDEGAGLAVIEAPWFGLPRLGHASWSFDGSLAAAFAIGAIAATMKAVGTIAVCERSNDADWIRPNMQRARRGVLADGIVTIVAGIAGAVGTSTSTPSVGLAASTGVVSRHVAYAVGALFLLLAFLPKLGAALAIMPRAVIAAALLFAMCSVIVNGIQIIASRLLDARRTIVIAVAIILGAAVDIFPRLAASVPAVAEPFVGSSLVLATVIALGLNLAFRVGVKKTVSLTLEHGQVEPQKVEDFFKARGAAWGARPDVISRATFGVIQLIDAVRGEFWHRDALQIKASFDEFNLKVDLVYDGDALEFPEQRPTNKQIRESEHGARLMAGFMLRKCADRLRSQSRDGRTSVHLHYDH
jgi:NCS2 family nucleobase:cation symporter-2